MPALVEVLFAPLGVQFALLALAAVALYRARTRAPRRSAGDGTVECPECAAENERGYRFCRACVSRLPGAAVPERRVDRSVGRPFR